MRNKNIIVAAAITATLFLIVSVAFAALASNLNISFGNVTQNALTWNVGFKGSSVTPTQEGTSNTGLNCGTATITPSTVTIADSTLSKPGDKCTYPLVIENTGDIAANLSNISATAPTDVSCNISGSTMVCGNITYELKNNSDSNLTTGITINKNESYNIKLLVSYTGETLNDTETTQRNAKFTLTYTQSDEKSSSGSSGSGSTNKVVCKRATTLHTETCDRGENGCFSAGYTTSGSKGTTTITYGSLGTSGVLSAGDAFDCDVNGDGAYDSTNERFYYVSKLNADNSSNYAVLILFSGVLNGEVTEGLKDFNYSNDNKNYEGPLVIYEHLPSTIQWSNVALTSQTRQIYSDVETTTAGGHQLPQFTYTNKAARLLTYKEALSACGEVDLISNRCEFLLENTGYIYGGGDYWLETTSTNDFMAWRVSGFYNAIDLDGADGYEEARPVIEVPLTDIEY